MHEPQVCGCMSCCTLSVMSDLLHVNCYSLFWIGRRGFLAAFGFLGLLPCRLRWGGRGVVSYGLPTAVTGFVDHKLFLHIHKLHACWRFPLQVKLLSCGIALLVSSSNNPGSSMSSTAISFACRAMSRLHA